MGFWWNLVQIFSSLSDWHDAVSGIRSQVKVTGKSLYFAMRWILMKLDTNILHIDTMSMSHDILMSRSQLNCVSSITLQCVMGFWWNLLRIFTWLIWRSEPNFQQCQSQIKVTGKGRISSTTSQCLMGCWWNLVQIFFSSPTFCPVRSHFCQTKPWLPVSNCESSTGAYMQPFTYVAHCQFVTNFWVAFII